MKKADYEAVCSKMRLADGTLWTMPITLDVSKEFAEKIKPGDHIALRDAEGVMRAHAIHVLTPGEGGITAITVFLEPALFGLFGMPKTLERR